MFGQKVAIYINNGMVEHKLSYKDLEKISGVPASTLHSWAQGNVKSPNDESLIRVAAAFGDPPEIIKKMRLDTLPSTAKENLIMARASDRKLMEEYTQLVNENVARLLEASRIDSDNRYVRRLNTVREQYDKLYEEQKANFAAQLEQHEKKAADAYEKATGYLKKDIAYYRKALRLTVIAALCIVIPIAAYAAYAFAALDLPDPARGVVRYEQTAAPKED